MENITGQYPLVAVFRNNKDTIPSEVIPLDEVLLRIKQCKNFHQITVCRTYLREGKKDEYDKLKDTFAGFTVCGTFEPSRAVKFLKTYSGFLILDIDKLQPEQVAEMKEKICALAYTFCCFVSPSGLGLKIIVQVSSDSTKHKTAYKQVKEFYENELGIVIDKSGSDVSRLCYFSSDCNLYLKGEAEIFNTQEEIKMEEKSTQHSILNTTTFSVDVFEKCVQLTENIYTFKEGERNNFVHLLAANCNRNGIIEIEASSKIKASYNYDDGEVSTTISNVYSNNRHEFGKFTDSENEKFIKHEFAKTGFVTLDVLIKRNQSEPPTEFIWSGIKKNSFGFIFGPSKSGKTTFAENLAMCLAAQLPEYFGKSITPDNYNVLFISLEEFWKNRTDRNEKQVVRMSNLTSDTSWIKNYKVVTEFVPRQVTSDADWKEIEKMIVESKANVVFIDSLTRLYEGGIEESSLAKKVAMRLLDIRTRLNITLIVIHHTTKALGKPLTQDSMAGSRILAQEVDFLLGISKSLENRRYFKEVTFRYCPEQSDTVSMFDIDSCQWLQKVAELPESALLKDADGREDDTNPEMLYNFIHEKTLSDTGRATTKELMEEFVKPKTMSKQTMYSSIDKLALAKRVDNTVKGIFKSITPQDNPE